MTSSVFRPFGPYPLDALIDLNWMTIRSTCGTCVSSKNFQGRHTKSPMQTAGPSHQFQQLPWQTLRPALDISRRTLLNMFNGFQWIPIVKHLSQPSCEILFQQSAFALRNCPLGDFQKRSERLWDFAWPPLPPPSNIFWTFLEQCYIMLHHVPSMLHHVTSCYIMLHHVTSCYIMLHIVAPTGECNNESTIETSRFEDVWSMCCPFLGRWVKCPYCPLS